MYFCTSEQKSQNLEIIIFLSLTSERLEISCITMYNSSIFSLGLLHYLVVFCNCHQSQLNYLLIDSGIQYVSLFRFWSCRCRSFSGTFSCCLCSCFLFSFYQCPTFFIVILKLPSNFDSSFLFLTRAFSSSFSSFLYTHFFFVLLQAF